MRTPLAARRAGAASRTSPPPTGSPSSTSSCRSPAATARAPDAPLVTLAAVAALLRRHLPADDPLAAYPDALEHRRTASATRAARLPHRQHRRVSCGGPDGRFVVVDYKTNWLGPVGRPAASR